MTSKTPGHHKAQGQLSERYMVSKQAVQLEVLYSLCVLYQNEGAMNKNTHTEFILNSQMNMNIQ